VNRICRSNPRLDLNPPLNAVVLRVDEKPGIQAIERASGLCGNRQRWSSARAEEHRQASRTAESVRRLGTGTGRVHAKFTDYKKRKDFQSFLDGVLADQPQDRVSGVNYFSRPTTTSLPTDLFFSYTDPSLASFIENSGG
jgi:hypothetical protein